MSERQLLLCAFQMRKGVIKGLIKSNLKTFSDVYLSPISNKYRLHILQKKTRDIYIYRRQQHFYNYNR
jgi:hypothetical protein